MKTETKTVKKTVVFVETKTGYTFFVHKTEPKGKNKFEGLLCRVMETFLASLTHTIIWLEQVQFHLNANEKKTETKFQRGVLMLLLRPF